MFQKVKAGGLREDMQRLRAFAGTSRVFLFALVDAGNLSLVIYRVLRAWRLTKFDVCGLRAVVERLVELATKIHLPSGLDAGPGLLIIHGHGLVVNANSRLGANVTLYHRVTIGVRFPGDDCPVIGDDVVVGCGAGIFGPVKIRSGARIAANAVITPKSCPKDICE